MKLSQRLEALEQQQPTKPVRMFTGDVAEDRYYECGSSAINYRNGINGAEEPGKAYSRSELAQLEKQGFQLTIIGIEYQDQALDGNFADILTGGDPTKGS